MASTPGSPLSFQAYDLARWPIYRRVPSTITAARTHLFFTRMNSVWLISSTESLIQICNDFDLDNYTLPFRSHQAQALQCHNMYIIPHFYRNLALLLHAPDNTLFDKFWYIFVHNIVADTDHYIDEKTSIYTKQFQTSFTREKFLIRITLSHMFRQIQLLSSCC